MEPVSRLGRKSPVTQTNKEEESSPVMNQLIMKMNILEMNMSLLSSQVSTSIQGLTSSISGINDSLNDIYIQLENLKLCKADANPLIRTDVQQADVNPPIRTNVQNMNKGKEVEPYRPILPIMESSTPGESYTHNTQSIIESFGLESLLTSNTLLTSTPIRQPSPETLTFSQIMTTQEKEKEKEKSSTNSPSPKEPNADIFEIPKLYNFYKVIIKKLNRLSLSHKTIKYVSHYAFNKAIIYPGTPPGIVRTLYQYGLIQSIYPSRNLSEIAELPEKFIKAVGDYYDIVTQHQVFIRCYSTVAEITPDQFYMPINLIRLGTTKKPLVYEPEVKEELTDDEDFQFRVSNIRAQDYHIIFQEMNRIKVANMTVNPDKEEKIYVCYCTDKTLMYSLGKKPKNEKQFGLWYDQIKKNKMENTPDTKRRICQIIGEYPNHECEYCQEVRGKDRNPNITMDPSLL